MTILVIAVLMIFQNQLPRCRQFKEY